MRSNQKQTTAVDRKKRSRTAGESDASFGSQDGVIRGIDSVKHNSGQKTKRMSNEIRKFVNKRENSEPQLVTPHVSSQKERARNETSANIGSSSKLSSSTPRRKRDLLANLHSDLSPKYIGFTSPPSCSTMVGNRSESDGSLQTRSARRRKLQVSTASPELVHSDSEVLVDTATALLGCVRRARNDALTPSPNSSSARKKFESPIDKLLARNGSAVVDDISKEKIVKNLDESLKSKLTSVKSECELETKEEFDENQCGIFRANNLAEGEENRNIFQTIVLGTEQNKESPVEETSHHVSDLKSEIVDDVQNEVGTKAAAQTKEISRKKNEGYSKMLDKQEHSGENVVVNPLVAVKIEVDSIENAAECNSESLENPNGSGEENLQYDGESGDSGVSLLLQEAVGYSTKSSSAFSLDRPKKACIVTGMDWRSFTTGDLFWGHIVGFCYWPCIVCPDPDGKTITTKRIERTDEEFEVVHVCFFADSMRRNYVKRDHLIPYTNLENYKQQMRGIRRKYGKGSKEYKLLLPKSDKVLIWREAIKEANKVAEILHEDRLKKLFEMHEQKKALRKQKRRQRRQRNLSADNRSRTSRFRRDSMEGRLVKNPLAIRKRARSTSPYSPAFSPLKQVSEIKRRKLSDTSTRELQASVNLRGDNTEALESCKNETPAQKENEEVNSSRSFTSLHAEELSSSEDYRNFYNAMKEFVMKDNNDDILEKHLIVAARNIWVLRQINQKQMQQKLLPGNNEQELDSTLVESGSGEGTVKRLSNRLKTMRFRHSLPAKINDPPYKETLEKARKEERKQGGGQVAQQIDNKPKRQLNRPIEEVIDDIFNLDNKYLFRGLAHDPVCKYCLRPGDSLVRCAKGCQSWLHADCIRKTSITGNIEKRNGRSKSESSNSRRNSSKWSVEMSLEKQSTQSIIGEERTASSSSLASYHVTADAETDEKIAEITCDSCALGKPPTCAVCKNANSSDPSREELVVCNMTQCSKVFHPACCRYWPQAKFTKSKNKIESFRCPSHVCHTCVSDNPKGKFQHLRNSKLTKCVKCPASYHVDSTCIPAGSQILTAAHIICPRHSKSGKTDGHVNVSWCFICVGGGRVICCETCPTAVHAECLNIALDPSEGYICEECESGRLPLYGEMVWAKFTSFRWWPAIILPPTEIPQNIRRKPHNPHDFVVRFFGTHDHGWISRRRVYLYLEGDSSEPPKTKSTLDQSYNRGVEEAKRIYEIIKSKKLAQRLTNESKEKLHPQPYVRIKVNRAVYPVKLHIDLEKVSKCECKIDDEDPCGPNSNCLNRVLYHECNPKVCPAGERCQNQMLESRLSPQLDVVYLKERGFGLVCRQAISAGDFVIEYVGEIIDDNEFRQRMSQKSLDRDENFYFLSVEKDYIIDAGPKGNLARFMNHSCDPNCETQKWSVNGLNRIALFAIKDIPANSELTFNYHWDDLLGNEKKICLCGSAKCVGVIGGKNKEEKFRKQESPAMEVNKTKSGTSRRRKPLKKLQNRGRGGNGKRASKKRTNVTVKIEPHTSNELADMQKIEDVNSSSPQGINTNDITAYDEENDNRTNIS